MQRGRLILIATPIGNLEDLSPRARNAIASCELLLCEDTRHTLKLFTHSGIEPPRMESFHEHNEREKLERVLDALEQGTIVGLVSDAGLPLLSDPGFPLMREVRRRGITVEPIPGPFAGALALVASGLAPIPFSFYGFVPHRQGERLDFFRTLAERRMTAIAYESPMRITDSLRDAATIFPDAEMTLAREMTKMHEEFINGTVSQVLADVEGRLSIRGEMTLVFALASSAVRGEVVDPAVLLSEFNRLRESGLRRGDAVKLLSEKYELNRKELYKTLLE